MWFILTHSCETTAEIRARMSNYIPWFYVDVIIHNALLMLWIHLISLLVKEVTGDLWKLFIYCPVTEGKIVIIFGQLYSRNSYICWNHTWALNSTLANCMFGKQCFGKVTDTFNLQNAYLKWTIYNLCSLQCYSGYIYIMQTGFIFMRIFLCHWVINPCFSNSLQMSLGLLLSIHLTTTSLLQHHWR